MSVTKSLVPPENVDLSKKGETPKYFTVHYGESQWGVQIEAKIKADDIQDVIDWVTENYTAYEYTDIDITDDSHAYMMINACAPCDLNDFGKPLEDNPCEYCETSMYFDISETQDPQEELNLIFPSFHTVTKGPMKHDAYHDITGDPK